MAADQGPVVQSALLRSELVRLRKGKGLTQEHVAKDLDWSPSKLIRVEGGRSSITKVDLDALLGEYGVTSESHRDKLQAFNKGARERAWWDDFRGDIDPMYLNYVGYEAGAAFIRQFVATVMPGLLQTREYAEALTVATTEAVRAAPVVRLRMTRQAKLAQRSSPPRQYYVLDEAVVRRHVGIEKDPAIMPDQLRYIADRAKAEELLTIRVIPFKAGAHRGLIGSFTLMEFEGGLPDLLYIDAGRGEIVLVAGDDPQVAEYADDFEALIERALPAGESIELIRSVAEDMS
jgi:transcriptional regulator with XRE-family HTH domain